MFCRYEWEVCPFLNRNGEGVEGGGKRGVKGMVKSYPAPYLTFSENSVYCEGIWIHIDKTKHTDVDEYLAYVSIVFLSPKENYNI